MEAREGDNTFMMCSCKGFLFFFFFLILWLCWVFVSVQGPSLVVASGGHSSSRCAGLSPSWPLLLRSTGSRRAGSAIVAHGPSCSAACGIFPDQGSNPCPLHWQADSQPLHHQGSPVRVFFSELVNHEKRRETQRRRKIKHSGVGKKKRVWAISSFIEYYFSHMTKKQNRQ